MTDSEGKPIKGAQVQPYALLASNGRCYHLGQGFDAGAKSQVETDAAGRFEVLNLPGRCASLMVTAAGYASGDVETFHDVPGAIQLRLNRTGVIRGRVVNKLGRGLLPGERQPLMVFLEATDPTARPQGAGATVELYGTFEFNNFPPGEYHVTLGTNPSRGRPRGPEQTVTVKPGAPATITSVLDQQ